MNLHKSNFLKTVGIAALIIGMQSCNLYKNLNNKGLSPSREYNEGENSTQLIKKNIDTERKKCEVIQLMTQLLDTVKNKGEFVGVIEPNLGREQYITREGNKYFYTKDGLKTYKALKSSNGEEIELILTYDSDLKFHRISDKIVKDAIKEISFIRKGEEYLIKIIYDEQHKAKLYGFVDGNMFEFYKKSHHNLRQLSTSPLLNIGYRKSCQLNYGSYNDTDIDYAILLLKEILGYDTSLSQDSIKETEQQINDIFEYGQKAIFKSSSVEFKNKTIEEGLNELYDILNNNLSLNIKITGYYGGRNSTLPLQRAEMVKKYLVKKGIKSDRIETEGSKEQVARSIKVEIVK